MEAISILCPLSYCFLNDGTNTNGCTKIRTASNVSVNFFINKAFFPLLFFFSPSQMFGDLRLSIRLIIRNILTVSLTPIAFYITQNYHPQLPTLLVIADSPNCILVLFREQKLFLINFFCKLFPPPFHLPILWTWLWALSINSGSGIYHDIKQFLVLLS